MFNFLSFQAKNRVFEFDYQKIEHVQVSSKNNIGVRSILHKMVLDTSLIYSFADCFGESLSRWGLVPCWKWLFCWSHFCYYSCYWTRNINQKYQSLVSYLSFQKHQHWQDENHSILWVLVDYGGRDILIVSKSDLNLITAN